MGRRLAARVLTGILAVGCQSVEGDPPASDVHGIGVIRWAFAASGPDILFVGGPPGVTPGCFRTI